MKDHDDLLLGKICPKCKNLLKEDKCGKCGDVDVVKLREKIQQASSYFASGKIIEAYEMQKDLIHPCHENMLVVTAELMKRSIDSQDYKAGLQYALLVLPIFECN